MSPIPSPVPLRRRLARILFSPAGLLCGFVVLLIVACPGARGDGSLGLIPAGHKTFTASADALRLDLPKPVVPAARPTDRPIGRSTRFDRVPPSAARSATPSERAAGPAASEAFRHSRSTLPLLVDPLLADAPRISASVRPMTGPPVGIAPVGRPLPR